MVKISESHSEYQTSHCGRPQAAVSNPLKPIMKTVVKAFKILNLFTGDSPELNLTEIVHQTGFSKTSTLGLLNTLVYLNCLTRNESYYRPGAKLFELGSSFIRQIDLRRMAMPYLVELAEKTEDTAYLCVIDNHEALCVARVEGKSEIRVLALQLGGRMALNYGAAPLVLLAGLTDDEIAEVARVKGLSPRTPNTITALDQLIERAKQVRQQGYAFSWEDVTEGVAAVGTPVRDFSGQVIGAISVAGVISRFGPDRLPGLIQMITGAAEALSQELGVSPRFTPTL